MVPVNSNFVYMTWGRMGEWLVLVFWSISKILTIQGYFYLKQQQEVSCWLCITWVWSGRMEASQLWMNHVPINERPDIQSRLQIEPYCIYHAIQLTLYQLPRPGCVSRSLVVRQPPRPGAHFTIIGRSPYFESPVQTMLVKRMKYIVLWPPIGSKGPFFLLTWNQFCRRITISQSRS